MHFVTSSLVNKISLAILNYLNQRAHAHTCTHAYEDCLYIPIQSRLADIRIVCKVPISEILTFGRKSHANITTWFVGE